MNVAALREIRRHSVRSLSALLGELGRPILPSGVSKIERQLRSVDVGDLVALAVALGVNPNRLLLPVDAPGEEIALTPTVTATHSQAWAWAQGSSPLLATVPDDTDPRVALDDFRRHVLPVDERLREDHTAVRAAYDVLGELRKLLELQSVDDSTPAGLRWSIERRGGSPEKLRRALARLVAEVDDVIGDDDAGR